MPPSPPIMENSASPSGQSSYPTPTGRPSLWSGSDQRKLARLYVYTTLPIQKILNVLQVSSDAHPGYVPPMFPALPLTVQR